jgi:quercetin dioxygenase-like cupin family protein
MSERITHADIYPKGWGRELWIANSEKYCGKILELNKGKKCSVHYHKIKDETFHILSGKVELRTYPEGYPGQLEEVVMNPGDTFHVPVGLVHQFYGLEDSKILEISTQHFEDDSYRLANGDSQEQSLA